MGNSGEDIVFLHGWGGSTDSFLGLARQLSNYYTVTVVDFYGFGKTPHPDYPLYLDDYVKSIVDIINHYKMTSVSLVGHSFGGRVALKFASKYGYMLERLVLIDSAGIKPRRGIKYYYRVYKHKLLKRLNIAHKAGSDDYRKLAPLMQKTFINIVNENLYPILPKITLPTLLIWGNKDKDTPIYMARKLNKKLTGSGIIVLKNAGHYSYLEQPLKVMLAIKSFVSEGL